MRPCVPLSLLLYCSCWHLRLWGIKPKTRYPRGKGHAVTLRPILVWLFPVFSSGPETYGYETVGLGYTFLNNNLEAGLNFGGIVTKGTLYTDSRMRGMMISTAYLSLLFGKKTGKLTICPTVEAGVGYGTTNHVRESVRAVFGVGTTLLYRPLKWFHTGIDLKYVFLSNSDNRWLMLGFKFGVDF